MKKISKYHKTKYETIKLWICVGVICVCWMRMSEWKKDRERDKCMKWENVERVCGWAFVLAQCINESKWMNVCAYGCVCVLCGW